MAAADIKVHFAGVKALDGVSLELTNGEILGLIGPNGAGKTTLINVLSGFQRPTKGAISLRGVDVSRWPPHRFPREGLVRTFQRAHPFAELTVLENAVVAAFGVGVGKRKAHEIARTALENVGLVDRASVSASILTAGQERRLGLARALATTPTFLLLDEPAAGLNEGEGDELVASIRRARADFGCGVLLVEHDMRVVMQVCDRVQVLNFGQTLKVGTPDEIRTDPDVLSAYLGPAVST